MTKDISQDHTIEGVTVATVSAMIFSQTLTAGSGEKVDVRTNHWPVRAKLRAELEAIKYDFKACPLPVYIAQRFIDPKNVASVMKGVLVEVQFEFKHFTINKKKEDSFCAIVQQVLVLKPGESRPVTAYKRKIVEEGPVSLHPVLGEESDEDGKAGCSARANGEEGTSARANKVQLQGQGPESRNDGNVEPGGCQLIVTQTKSSNFYVRRRKH